MKVFSFFFITSGTARQDRIGSYWP